VRDYTRRTTLRAIAGLKAREGANAGRSLHLRDKLIAIDEN